MFKPRARPWCRAATTPAESGTGRSRRTAPAVPAARPDADHPSGQRPPPDLPPPPRRSRPALRGVRRAEHRPPRRREPPAQVLGASQVSLRAETDPPTEGTFTWTSETEGVQLESEGPNLTLELGEDPPAEVAVRCSFVSQTGNAFEAEHALTTGFAFRYQHPEGEVTETPPRGTGEDEDAESYLEYSGRPPRHDFRHPPGPGRRRLRPDLRRLLPLRRGPRQRNPDRERASGHRGPDSRARRANARRDQRQRQPLGWDQPRGDVPDPARVRGLLRWPAQDLRRRERDL